MPNTNAVKLSEIEEVCIIDDDYVPRFLAEKIFEYEMPTVESKSFDGADSALFYLNANPFKKRAILLDINMPQKDGWDFIANFEKPATTLLFILSSSSQNSDKEKASGFSFIDGYLEKPLTIEQMDYLKSNY